MATNSGIEIYKKIIQQNSHSGTKNYLKSFFKSCKKTAWKENLIDSTKNSAELTLGHSNTKILKIPFLNKMQK